MRRRLFLAGLAVLPTLTFTGCATTSNAQADRGKGVIVSYAAPYDKMWAALMDILKDLGLKVGSADEQQGVILIGQGASAFSWGERVAIFVERIGTQGNTRVEVVSKDALGTNITATDWAQRVHERLASRFKRY